MSWFTNAMKDLAGRKGATKLKTTITRKTEEGNVTVTVKGIVATDAETLADAARSQGATVAAKGGTFRAAEGSQGAVLTGEDAEAFTILVTDPDSFKDKAKSKQKQKQKEGEEGTVSEEDTALENAGK